VKKDFDLYFGGAQGVVIRPDAKLHGGADPRRDGQAEGY
jgi:gamma-glutamyltranspeptidase/glutathione hydrolase